MAEGVITELGRKIFLCIDYSNEELSVAIFDSAKCLASLTNNYKDGDLVQMIDQIFKASKIEAAQLDFIACTNGPGPFTAIRVSLALVTAMAMSLNIPVFTIESLLLTALKLFDKGAQKIIYPVFKGYSGEFFVAGYIFEEDRIIQALPIGLYTPKYLLSILKHGAILTGLGASAIAGLQAKEDDFIEFEIIWESGELAKVLGNYILRKTEINTVSQPDALYLKPSQAEINFTRGKDGTRN